jgi:hypothetical protein
MRDVTLPAAMTLMMAGLMLGSQSANSAIAAALLAGGMAVLLSLATIPLSGETAIIACCLTTALVGLTVYWSHMLQSRTVIVVALIAGIVAGLALGVTTGSSRAYPAILGLLTVLPASIAERKNFGIARRVVASWLVAVAVLAAVLPYVIAHPGYVPDHRG